MSKASFENDSLGWQSYKLYQRITEWWELQTRQLIKNIPDFDLPDWLNSQIAKALFVILLFIVLFWFILQITTLLTPYFWELKQRFNQSVTSHQKPSEKELTLTQLLQKASQFQQNGNYYQACRCLYLATLQKLNDQGFILHNASRTDGEYEKLIQKLSHPQPYKQIFNIHQQLCFGNLEATSSEFEQCQQAYNRIRQE